MAPKIRGLHAALSVPSVCCAFRSATGSSKVRRSEGESAIHANLGNIRREVGRSTGQLPHHLIPGTGGHGLDYSNRTRVSSTCPHWRLLE